MRTDPSYPHQYLLLGPTGTVLVSAQIHGKEWDRLVQYPLSKLLELSAYRGVRYFGFIVSNGGLGLELGLGYVGYNGVIPSRQYMEVVF